MSKKIEDAKANILKHFSQSSRMVLHQIDYVDKHPDLEGSYARVFHSKDEAEIHPIKSAIMTQALTELEESGDITKDELQEPNTSTYEHILTYPLIITQRNL